MMLLTVRLLYELFKVTALILLKKNGAGGRNRTDMELPPEDFESIN